MRPRSNKDTDQYTEVLLEYWKWEDWGEFWTDVVRHSKADVRGTQERTCFVSRALVEKSNSVDHWRRFSAGQGQCSC